MRRSRQPGPLARDEWAGPLLVGEAQPTRPAPLTPAPDSSPILREEDSLRPGASNATQSNDGNIPFFTGELASSFSASFEVSSSSRGRWLIFRIVDSSITPARYNPLAVSCIALRRSDAITIHFS
ncbi:MAG: hypothetical protein AAFQ83_19185 [Bacteroidota bacterium]